MIASTTLLGFSPLIFVACAVAMVVLRASGSRVFFDVVGTFQASKLLNDVQASATVLESLYMDSLMAIQEAGAEIGMMFTDLVDSVIPVTVEIENARVEFEKFVDNVEEAKALEQEIQAIGLSFGFMADEAFVAGARMAQLSGVLGGQGSTAVGTELGMMFGLISGMETEAAMQRLINLNQQTKFMTKNLEEGMTAEQKANQIRVDSIRILDQLNTVENRSAATMQQITFVMNQFASQAHLTNESIAAMAAMSATLIEAGEEQGKGGRALRMIYARLGADTNGARTFIENLGIAVIDTEGDMRPFSDLLVELAERYHTLTGEQQQEMAQSIAGNRHYTRLIKLLENVDRVRELELEAMLAQFPARDELQRRLDSEVFAYEQSEAAIQNYSAAFGNALLPALTKANNQQALFFRNLGALVEGPLGRFASGIILMSRLMSNFMGPTFAAIVAIKNLQIALQTQHVVMRALNGEQIAAVGAAKHFSASQVMAAFSTGQLSEGLSRETLLLAAKRASLVATIEKMMQEAYAYRNLSNVAEHRIGVVQREVVALASVDAQLEKATQGEHSHGVAMEITNNKMLQKSLLTTQYTMKIGALGTAFMMFGKNDKHMRVGMLLTTAAMSVQMYTALKSAQAMLVKSAADTTNIGTTTALTWQTRALDVALKGVTHSSVMASMAFKNLGASFVTLSKRLVVLYLAVETFNFVLDKLGLFKMPDFDEDGEFANSIADTSLVMDYLKLSTEELTEELDKQRTLQKVYADATDSTGIQIKQAADNAVLAGEAVERMRGLETIAWDENTDAIQRYLDATELLGSEQASSGFLDGLKKGADDTISFLEDSIGKVAFIARTQDEQGWRLPENAFLDFITGGRRSDREEALNVVEDFVIDYVELYEFAKDKTFEGIDEMEAAFLAFKGVGKGWEDPDDITGGVVEAFDAATDSMYEFNNAREEMFFGFSSDRLTGDLIRQVKQQGVETLITTTEVIMHNNFNGLTVPEVADQIIEEIESRGNLRNYNMATS